MTGFAEYRPGASMPRLAVTVRTATLPDVDAMLRVQQSAGRPAHPEHYRRAMTDDGRCVVVATTTSDECPLLVGWAQTYRHTERHDVAPAGHYLGGVTVHPAWRRRGVGSELTEARLRWIGRRAGEAFYVVNAGNQVSIDLHHRWGFREIARAARLTGIEFSGGVGLLLRATLDDTASSHDGPS